MNLFVDDPDFTLHLGDVRDVLPTLEADSVDCALTSPPFYALRDYDIPPTDWPPCGLVLFGLTLQIPAMTCCLGLEPTPEAWAAHLLLLLRDVRRALKPQGTLWIECGDSYSSRGGDREYGSWDGSIGRSSPGPFRPGNPDMNGGNSNRDGITVPGYKPKDLIGTPWLLAFALRADGWWLRQAIVWHKPNAMPESVTDRCTTAHSYVFLLSKQARYFFDAEAIAEPAEWARWGDQTTPKYEGTDTASGWMQPKTKNEIAAEFDHRRPIGQKWVNVTSNSPGRADVLVKGFDLKS